MKTNQDRPETEDGPVKKLQNVSKELFIKELERPAAADKGMVTTLAIGEEACKPCKGTKGTSKQK